MADSSKLYLQIADGHLRLMPQGNLTNLGVKRILGAAQAGLRVFSVIVVDLQKAGEVSEEALAMLEEGLGQIIAERKQVLLTEPGTPDADCRCKGDCSRCRSRSLAEHEVSKKRTGTA